MAVLCASCGHTAAGNFCANCGKTLAVATALTVETSDAADATPTWHYEVNYERLIQVPEVRSAIEGCAAQAKKPISGEQLLALADKVLPQPIPLKDLVAVVQPLLASWGIGTGKQREAIIAAPIGQTLCRVLCTLARHAHTLRKVNQGADGCLLEADLPSDLWTLEGDLLIAVRIQGERTLVQAATVVTGQFFDWGKGKRCLDRLLGELQSDPAAATASWPHAA